MRMRLFVVFAFLLAPMMVQAQLFEPGNVIFADPFYSPDGQIVELNIDGNEAEVINVIRWDLEDTDRRRALGLDVDPEGVVWVGITAVFEPDPENEYPDGIGEMLRIDSEGNQQLFMADIIKITHLAAIGPGEVVVNSNVDDQDVAWRYKIADGDITEWSDYVKGGHGEALLLPDGRLLMGDANNPGIHVYDKEEGGEPTGVFYNDDRVVRSLTYNDEIGSVVASLGDQSTLVRISLDGELEEEYNAVEDGFTGIWGIAQIPGTTNFVVGNHDVPELLNKFGVFDATDLNAGPRIIDITSGFEQAGLEADASFRSFFNMAVVPGGEFPSDVSEWAIY